MLYYIILYYNVYNIIYMFYYQVYLFWICKIVLNAIKYHLNTKYQIISHGFHVTFADHLNLIEAIQLKNVSILQLCAWDHYVGVNERHRPPLDHLSDVSESSSELVVTGSVQKRHQMNQGLLHTLQPISHPIIAWTAPRQHTVCHDEGWGVGG